MLDRPRWTRHGQGLALLFANLFVGLSLAGYNPADPPSPSAWSAGAESPTNPCGPVGAACAFFLFQSIGWASLGLVWGLVVLAAHRLGDRSIPEPHLTLGGLLITLAVAAGLIQTLAPTWQPSPPVGSGGYVGAVLAAFLFDQFGPLGRMLILGALGILGLAFAHETFLTWPVRELVRGCRALPCFRSTAGRLGSAHAYPHGDGSAVLAPLHPIHSAHVETSLPGPAPRAALPRASAGGPAIPSLMPAVRRHESTAYFPVPADGSYVSPPPELLDPPAAFPVGEHEAKIQERALLLEKTLREHGCVVRVVQIDTGPVITQFEVELEAGLRVSKVAGLSNDLAIALAVPSVRIVAPIPGKTTVGIEVPNDRRGIVRLGEVIAGVGPQLAQSKLRIPLFLGKDVKGNALAFDLADMPHLLIAGRTGTGKSVCLNAMILSILMTRRPDDVKLLLIDPKMVELSQFKRIPHLMHPVITDMKKAESVLAWACEKMDERYAILARAGVRNLQAYNALGAEEIYNRLRPETDEERERIPTHMPYIVIIADEMADLMMIAAKEVETHIVRLAQKARAVGMHLIVATQKPTVDVITGLIKGNLPARISFQVASRGDSRVVLDEMGADKLLGNGDMLFLVPGTSHIVRAQGTFVSDGEVNRVCAYLEQYPVEFSKELVQMQVGGAFAGKDREQTMSQRDELYEAAIEIVIREQRGSTSLLQRALGIGYGRAARLIDYMAEDGIVGEFKSGSAREVLYSWDDWERMKNADGGSGAAA